MRIIVARHAQTLNNNAKILQGSGAGTGSGASLTELGKRQSEKLCSHLLSEFDVKAIFTSPAKRTLETIEPMKALVSACYEEESVREIDCGDWEGKSIASLESEFKLEWQRWKTEPLSFTFPGGESLQDVSNRTHQFLKVLLNGDHSGDVLLMSHSATISTLVANIMDVDLADAWETGLGYHKNAQYSVFNFDEQGALLDHSLKIDKHLINLTHQG